MSDDNSCTDTSRPCPVNGLRGTVTQALYARGSKSERMALFIDTERGRFLLRRKRGPAMGDKQLLRFEGKQVECDGFIAGDALLAERVTVITKD